MLPPTNRNVKRPTKKKPRSPRRPYKSPYPPSSLPSPQTPDLNSIRCGRSKCSRSRNKNRDTVQAEKPCRQATAAAQITAEKHSRDRENRSGVNEKSNSTHRGDAKHRPEKRDNRVVLGQSRNDDTAYCRCRRLQKIKSTTLVGEDTTTDAPPK